jgi:hypothetical protein
MYIKIKESQYTTSLHVGTNVIVTDDDGKKYDVRQLIERNAELEKTDILLKELLYCCDSLHNDYMQCNYGDANGWLRHIANAYGKYEDSIDLLQKVENEIKC